jgi:hypothetical protein
MLLSAFKQFFFFLMQVHSNFSTSVNFNVNYNKKSPYRTSVELKQYQLSNPNVDYSGNQNLQPTIF